MQFSPRYHIAESNDRIAPAWHLSAEPQIGEAMHVVANTPKYGNARILKQVHNTSTIDQKSIALASVAQRGDMLITRSMGDHDTAFHGL